MKRNRCPSPQTISVLLALSKSPQAWRYGYDLCQETGLQAGTMYPILMRLTDQGFLETKWEPAKRPGSPPRHLYRLSNEGRLFAADLARAAKPIVSAKASRYRPGMEGAT